MATTATAATYLARFISTATPTQQPCVACRLYHSVSHLVWKLEHNESRFCKGFTTLLTSSRAACLSPHSAAKSARLRRLLWGPGFPCPAGTKHVMAGWSTIFTILPIHDDMSELSKEGICFSHTNISKIEPLCVRLQEMALSMRSNDLLHCRYLGRSRCC